MKLFIATINRSDRHASSYPVMAKDYDEARVKLEVDNELNLDTELLEELYEVNEVDGYKIILKKL